MSKMIRVIAQFSHKSDGTPITGQEYVAKLYDKDILLDDEMGESYPDSKGRIDILCPLALASSFDSPGEQKPDLYFVLLENGKEIFRSHVFKNVDFLGDNPSAGLRQDLGEFRV